MQVVPPLAILTAMGNHPWMTCLPNTRLWMPWFPMIGMANRPAPDGLALGLPLGDPDGE